MIHFIIDGSTLKTLYPQDFFSEELAAIWDFILHIAAKLRKVFFHLCEDPKF